MASDYDIKFPVINFSNLNQNSDTTEWNAVKNEVYRALETYGCFEALFDKIPVEIWNAIFGAAEELFDLPIQTKVRNISKKPFYGYLGQYPFLPLYESMGIDDANILSKVETFTTTLWSEGNPKFSQIIQSYSEQLSKLDQIIRKMIVESLGLEKYTVEHMESTNYLLRVMKYKGPKTGETKVGLPSHNDKNIVTILHQNQVEGLGVQTKDGEWIEVTPSKDSFIVMIGESLTAWTNGRLYAPYHRVMMSGDETRYSVGLFSMPKGGYIIKAPEEMVDEQHPLLYKPYDNVEFLDFYHSEEGKRVKSAFQVYCGV